MTLAIYVDLRYLKILCYIGSSLILNQHSYKTSGDFNMAVLT